MERPAARQREDPAPLRPLKAPTLPSCPLRGPASQGTAQRRASLPCRRAIGEPPTKRSSARAAARARAEKPGWGVES